MAEVRGSLIKLTGSVAYQHLDEKQRAYVNFVDKTGWYPLSKFLDIIDVANRSEPNELRVNARSNAIAFIPTAARAKITKNPREALSVIDDVYYQRHRGEEAELGHYWVEFTGEKSARVLCNVPYCASFNQGLIEGFVTVLGGAVIVQSTVVLRGTDEKPQTEILIEWD